MANELKTASVLAFERKLDPSDALMYGGDWNNRAALDNWAPITLREKSVRGTISNRLKGGARCRGVCRLCRRSRGWSLRLRWRMT